jgi:gas vesicle protein
MARKNANFEYFALGFIAGMAVGAAVALLGAPKSGRLMRRDLKRNLEDASEAVRDKIGDQMRDLQENLRDVESALKDVASKVRQKI